MEKHSIVNKAYFMFDKEEAETIIRFFDLDTPPRLYQGQQFDHILGALLLIKSKGRITNDDRTEFNVLLYHEVPVLKMLAILHRTSEDCMREEFKRNGITWNDLLASMSIKCTAVAQVYADEIVIPKPLIDPSDIKPMTSDCERQFSPEGSMSKFISMINRWLKKY